MDRLSSMNSAMAYIEEQLAGEIDMSEVSRRALCSEYHFKRMFSFLAGVSLSEYIRRRRMTLAAHELQKSGIRVIDVAVKYGYTSADSFSRAFASQHGLLPSEARSEGARLTSYPKMTFQLSIKGADEMNYRIVQKEAFALAGFMKRVPIVFEGVNPEIAKMNEHLTPDVLEQLDQLSTIEPSGIISASVNFSEGRMEEKGELDHYIGVATDRGDTGAFDVLPIQAGTWAVFEAVGSFPEALQDVWGRIYAEWFPSSGYEVAEGPEILWNGSTDLADPQFRSEIWIPVKKANH